MTLPIIALIALLAGLAAAAAVWIFTSQRGAPTGATYGASRFVVPAVAFVVAAAIVGGALFALGRAPSPAGDGPERKVLEAIQRHHPEAAADIAAIRRETDYAVAQRRSSELAQRYLPRHIPTTSDGAVIRFTSEMTKVFENLTERDPESCKALASGGRVGATFDSTQMRPALDAMAQVIDDSVDSPQPPPRPERAQQLLTTVVERVYAGKTDLATPQQLMQPAVVPAAQLCRTMVAFYREILNLPSADASAVLRTLMRSGAR
jgi:hypothetical protein